jgi:hypothetical protein
MGSSHSLSRDTVPLRLLACWHFADHNKQSLILLPDHEEVAIKVSLNATVTVQTSEALSGFLTANFHFYNLLLRLDISLLAGGGISLQISELVSCFAYLHKSSFRLCRQSIDIPII